jgi:hypothetical protein
MHYLLWINKDDEDGHGQEVKVRVEKQRSLGLTGTERLAGGGKQEKRRKDNRI